MTLIPKTWSKHHFAFGGSLLKGSHPKKKRIFREKLALHIVMKSSQALGKNSLLRYNEQIDRELERQAARHSVKVFAAANGGNHLHLLIQTRTREQLSAFLRSFSGRVAQLVVGRKTESQRRAFKTRFWDARPFSRLVSWGQDFKNVCRYLGINAAESLLGFCREAARDMDKQIENAIRSGQLRKSPALEAAGFV